MLLAGCIVLANVGPPGRGFASTWLGQGMYYFFNQNWRYFTKGSRNPKLFLYQYQGEKWGKISRTAGEKYLGFDKKARHLNQQLDAIMGQVPHDCWLLLSSAADIDSAANLPSLAVNVLPNSFKFPVLCGDYVVHSVTYPKNPWGVPWLDQIDTQRTNFVIRVRFTCN